MVKSAAVSETPSRDDLENLQASAAAAARLMKVLGNEQRLLLLCRMGEGEVSVGELGDYAGLAQSAASQHLAKMRDLGLVETRRDGQTIYYRLIDQDALRVIGLLCEIYRGKDGKPKASNPPTANGRPLRRARSTIS